MNKLPIEKRVQIINLLAEGSSLRATSRICDVSINTVTKLLVDVGRACQTFHNEMVRDITCQKCQADEIWSFVYSKEKNVPENKEGEAGDVWTFVGIDADAKLVISWLVGARDLDTATMFMGDLAYRVKNRMQLTTDGLRAYLVAVGDNFGSQIDYAQLVKIYGTPSGANPTERKYSPAECTGATKKLCQVNQMKNI